MTPARVLITRDPAAAHELAALLRERGHEPCASPMLEAQLPADPSELAGLLDQAAHPSGPTWLCVTSATTVAALDAVAQSPDWGAQLEAARATGLLRVAAVGEATARALGEYGVGLDFVPSRVQSAAGMVAQWPEHPGARSGEDSRKAPRASQWTGPTPLALLPVSALGSDTLCQGLRELGYDVRRVTAYEMVPVPAERPVRRREPEPLAGSATAGEQTSEEPAAVGPTGAESAVEELAPEAARAACAAGEVAAVVVTAPSRAAALLDGQRPAADVAWVAIGEPTARALRERGLSPVTAARPTPRDLADAVDAALGTARTAGRTTAGTDARPTTCTDTDQENEKMNDDEMSYDLVSRPRRLRTTPAMRRFAAETRVTPSELILPVFVKEGLSEPQPLASMPGVVQHSMDSLKRAAAEAVELGLSGFMLFGMPETRDAVGSAALDPEGILNRGIRAVREEVGDEIVVMSDLCLDEFTDHGHCGVLDEQGRVDNDRTLEIYGRMGVAQAQAGAHMVAPSGMMDGQVGVIRAALDAAGREDVSILAYSAKYSSAFYGPFREAVDSTLTGDRKAYQMDPANRREALLEMQLDLDEGADMVMVKPAMSYLDILREVADASPVPVSAYQISGEYAMIEAAAANGWINRDAAVRESVLSIKRAGANSILTYYATELARWFRDENGR